MRLVQFWKTLKRGKTHSYRYEMMRDIFLYLVLIILFGLIFLAQLIVNVYAFQRQPAQKSRTVIFV